MRQMTELYVSMKSMVEYNMWARRVGRAGHWEGEDWRGGELSVGPCTACS